MLCRAPQGRAGQGRAGRAHQHTGLAPSHVLHAALCGPGESAFLELYQKLYDAPDPAPALAVAFETASRVADLEV